ncbi:MAG: DNRLRE domain-containing protein, partial [Planctomycetota bacterium]
MRGLIVTVAAALPLAAVHVPATADTVTLSASQDTTILSSDTDKCNGSGDYMCVGNTNGNGLRRGLIAFDLTGIEPGSTITSVSLTLHHSQGAQNGTRTFTLHRLTSEWGEAGSDAGGNNNEGGCGGDAAQTGDATWTRRMWPDTSWSSNGGDFIGSASASLSFSGSNSGSFHTWSSAGMVADVQQWLDNPSSNFGWIVRGQESGGSTAKRFDTSEHPTAAFRPELVVDFTPPLVTGACCFDDGSCMVMSEGDCDGAGGAYEGDDSICAPNPCPQPGACCFAGGTCTVELMTDCTMAGGAFQGEGTSCAGNCLGACCLMGGTCEESTLADCTTDGGVYQGFDTDCDPNPCPEPQGACCFDDGLCSSLSATACGAQGGAYQGDDTLCDPNPCPQPGACCLGDGSCVVDFESACTMAGGAYQGDGSTCDPNPCPQPGACC